VRKVRGMVQNKKRKRTAKKKKGRAGVDYDSGGQKTREGKGGGASRTEGLAERARLEEQKSNIKPLE